MKILVKRIVRKIKRSLSRLVRYGRNFLPGSLRYQRIEAEKQGLFSIDWYGAHYGPFDSIDSTFADYVGHKGITAPLRHAYLLAVADNLFNAQWYEVHYGKFPHPIMAFADYVEKSKFSNINPSALFDTEFYLRSNMDLYHSDVSPLVHYLYHGRQESRRSSHAYSRWHPKNQLVAVDESNWNQQKIAICLHIFYADFVEKFAKSLRDFPCYIDVFVAVSNEQIKQDAQRVFAVIRQVRQLKIVIAPNRGRNFGPLLVEFGKELLNYDLMCHLHSKKSLYSGREQTQWFDYLHQYLMKDRHVVACLLRLFKTNPDLGMYYPTSFWMMPSWVNHWTCNKGFAQGFVKDWGLDINENFVNYPVGGMFWARPAAIKQLLEMDYQYEDFPVEPLPNDGSWLHALERTVGLLAEKNDYKQFFYNPPTSQFTTDKSYIFINYHKPPEQLFNEVRNFDVVSFDIFDTVLRREYTEPEYAKLKLGQYLTDLDVVANPHAFVKLRNKVEFELRQRNDFKGDVSIVDVYKTLAELWSCEEEQALEYMHLEFSFDLEQVRAKDEMLGLIYRLADLGCEIWFVSDIYYTEQQVTTMLKKIGVTVPYRLFVSSELGLRKDSGTMWHYIKNELNTVKLSHIHIGDNVRADAQICGDFGLTNMHVLHPVDKWQAAGLKPVFHSQNHLDEANILKWGKLVGNLGRYPFFGE
jgi:FMN phosphatase YigB (HAD superfamily)